MTLSIIWITFNAGYSQASIDPSPPSVFDWFHSPEEEIEVELQTNLELLADQKMTNEELPAQITITNKEGQIRTFSAKLRARGRFRRRICEFPPIKIDFSKDTLREYGLSSFDEYKLVTHCFDNRSGDDNVLKEYLTYRLYQQLTDKSFRVQLLKIKYLDEKGKRRMTAYGFLLEDEKEMARRLDAELREGRYNVAKDSFLLADLHRHDLFQYMVCNTDWNLPMVRNMKLLWYPELHKYAVVPYDFDFSGLVNAPYAVPNADLGQRSVRERHYMGVAESEEELAETLAWFRSRRNALLKYIKDFKPLTGEARRDMMEYLDSFYESLENGAFREALKR